MSAVARVAAIGEQVRVQGFALAGAATYPAEDAAAIRAAWVEVVSAGDIDVVVLTPGAARTLEASVLDALHPLVVVMPE